MKYLVLGLWYGSFFLIGWWIGQLLWDHEIATIQHSNAPAIMQRGTCQELNQGYPCARDYEDQTQAGNYTNNK